MLLTTPFLLALAMLNSQCGKQEAPPAAAMQMPPASVTVAPVAEKKLVEWQEFAGRLEASEVVELRPRVSGYLESIHFKAGQMVNKGDKLFVIDRSTFEAQLAQAQAELKRAEVTVSATKKEFDRVQALLAARAMSPEQADAKESAFLQAEAALEGAKAALRFAEIQLSHTIVEAPISGRISREMVTPGNYLSGMAGAATLLTTIVSVEPVYAYLDIDETSLLKLQALRREKKLFTNKDGFIPVKMQLSGEEGYPHEGFIESFDNRLDASTGSLIVRAQFADPNGLFLPGLFVRVQLPMTAEYPALMITDSAVLTDQANKYVLGVTEQNLTEYKPVVLGPTIDGQRIIRSGLKKGDVIIINGQARLPMPGMPVAPVPAEAAAPPAASPAKEQASN